MCISVQQIKARIYSRVKDNEIGSNVPQVFVPFIELRFAKVLHFSQNLGNYCADLTNNFLYVILYVDLLQKERKCHGVTQSILTISTSRLPPVYSAAPG